MREGGRTHHPKAARDAEVTSRHGGHGGQGGSSRRRVMERLDRCAKLEELEGRVDNGGGASWQHAKRSRCQSQTRASRMLPSSAVCLKHFRQKLKWRSSRRDVETRAD
ncbi:hypothetical protein FNV43_RR17657 [Rhamnella rubrinervis]|uniref:Uncharacterized protein n=1 Tax=Rhamnella rubrinervis TaxID=2594499 RepID=A0A8K0E4P5_9ROSA|nr:hypothetical protein FNV43_RR17657 [Rhamnella rubrinervis]